MCRPHQLDARGLLCPLPVIRTQDRLRTLQSGEELIVNATDPGALADIPAWCRVHGHTILSTVQDASMITFHIRKS